MSDIGHVSKEYANIDPFNSKNGIYRTATGLASSPINIFDITSYYIGLTEASQLCILSGVGGLRVL
jgi:hypothetical protein